ncbi:MAG: cytochrome c [Isosphaeraceae bacterium]
MRALYCAASLLGVLSVIVWASSPAGAWSEDEAPTARQIMTKVHKGPRSLFNTVKAQLKGNSPNWPKVEETTGNIEKLASSLPETKPARGNRAAYEKLAKAYASNFKTLHEAAENQDLAKARQATEKIGGSCAACHRAHRRKGG